MNLGSLFVVSTPIGNLKDITYRAIDVLKEVEYIVCEDSRITKRLLDKYNISRKMITYNEYNEIKKTDSIIKILTNGLDVALVSDAGTPCISDPGYRLISKIKEENCEISVIPVPGASASTSSLSISGLPSDCFYFIGFLPKKKGRQKKIKEMKDYQGSVIIYESPNRISRTLSDLFSILGNRRVFIIREMTKIYEESHFTDLKSINSEKVKLIHKGEYVIIVAKEGYKD